MISILVVVFAGAGLFAGLKYMEKRDAEELLQVQQAIFEEESEERLQQQTEEQTEDNTQEEGTQIKGDIQTADTMPLKTPTETASESSMIFAGDVCLSGHVTGNYDAAGIHGVVEETLQKQMQEADICMINEEFPFGTGGVQAADKEYTFRVSPSYVTIFQDMGVDIVSLANNHVLDYGQEVLRETFATLKETDILYAGAGETVEEAGALQTIQAGGKTCGFLAASRVIPVEKWNVENAQPGVFTTYDKTALVAAIEAAEDKCDFLTVYVHWGIERNTIPEEYQKELAHSYIDAGADLVIGAHPHVLQGIEAYGGKLIFYSLGNFIFNQSIEKTMLLKVTQQQEQTEYLLLPAYATGAKTQPYPDVEEFYAYLESISEGISIEGGVIRIL